MKDGTKIALLVAGILLILGLGAMTGGMGALRFDFKDLGTADPVTRTAEFTEPVTDISMSGVHCETVLKPASDGVCRVVFTGEEKLLFRALAENGKLTVSVEDKRKWYEMIGVFSFSDELTVFLPEREYGSLTAELTSGSLEIPEDFAFSALTAENASGAVKLAASADRLNVHTTSGSISVNGVRAKQAEIGSSSGSVRLSEVTAEETLAVQSLSGLAALDECSAREISVSSTSAGIRLSDVDAEESLTVETTSGSIVLEKGSARDISASSTSGGIRLSEADAEDTLTVESISGGIRLDGGQAQKTEITSSSGSVKGTVTGEYLYDVRTSSGSISVPKSGGSRLFRVTTSSGSVRIEQK